MSKKQKATDTDFHFGIGTIIPSTQEAYHDDFEATVRKAEKTGLVQFKDTLGRDLDARLEGNEQFPSNGEIFVFIVQYFTSKNEYSRRDIDNIAKTILDVLKGKFYKDDSQVKTLLIGKKMEWRVSQNFGYVAVQELRPERDVDALKISGVEKSVTLFHELKSKGLL